MATLTIAEAVISQLIARGTLDETNPQLLRHYQDEVKSKLGIEADCFYARIYDGDNAEEEAELDRIVESLFYEGSG